jgi:hypothetical protein
VESPETDTLGRLVIHQGILSIGLAWTIAAGLLSLDLYIECYI